MAKISRPPTETGKVPHAGGPAVTQAKVQIIADAAVATISLLGNRSLCMSNSGMPTSHPKLARPPVGVAKPARNPARVANVKQHPPGHHALDPFMEEGSIGLRCPLGFLADWGRPPLQLNPPDPLEPSPPPVPPRNGYRGQDRHHGHGGRGRLSRK